VASGSDPGQPEIPCIKTPAVENASAVIRGAIQAERDGYDAFFMNHFQDVPLFYPLRAWAEPR